MAAVTATTYEYGGAQQGYNPYDAYSHGGASAYQWPQPNAAPAQPQQAKAAPQVLLATPSRSLKDKLVLSLSLRVRSLWPAQEHIVLQLSFQIL